MFEILLDFIIGGILVSVTSYIGRNINSLIAAIFWSYPIALLPILYSLRRAGKNNGYLAKYLNSTLYGSFLLMFTVSVMIYFIKLAPEDQPLSVVILKSTIAYLFGALIYYYSIKLFG